MKKVFYLFLCLAIVTMSVLGCNTSPDNDSTNEYNAVTTVKSESLGDTSKNTTVIYESHNFKQIIIASIEELSEMRKMISCTDQEELEKYMSSIRGGSVHKVEDIIMFLNLVDSVPYFNPIGGDIVQIENLEDPENIESTSLRVSIAMDAEKGYGIRVIYLPKLIDPVSTAELRASEAASLISQPISSEDGRVTIWAEFRDSHPVYPNANYVEWIAIIDGIFTEILYVFPNTENINTEEFLESISISSIAQLYTVAPELMEQISEGMTYKEVKEIIGALRKDVSSGNIVFEYYLTDGRAAQIEFQKLNETDDLNDFTVKSITIE